MLFVPVHVPSLFDSRLTGGPSLSTRLYTFSNPAFALPDFTLAHMVTIDVDDGADGAGYD